jgi:hypothetical protein
MRTLVENGTNVSIHLFNDDDGTTLEADGLYRNGELLDARYNSAIATIESVDSVPEGWYGRAYLLVNGTWEDNPNKPV